MMLNKNPNMYGNSNHNIRFSFAQSIRQIDPSDSFLFLKGIYLNEEILSISSFLHQKYSKEQTQTSTRFVGKVRCNSGQNEKTSFGALAIAL